MSHIDTLWWNRLVNSVRFLDDVQDAAMEGKSVLLCFDGEIPWCETMLDTLEQRLGDITDSRAVDVLDVSGVDLSQKHAAGAFLMNRYCDRKERGRYWPTTHGSPERFLAQTAETPLNKRYVCLTGIGSESLGKWSASVAEYLDNCRDPDGQGIFLLIAACQAAGCPRQLQLLRYADYVSDYDCMMLCLTLISGIRCSRTEKMYLCEAASGIARGSVELAGLLASEGTALLRDPLSVAERVCRTNGFDTSGLPKQVPMAMWEAQIKLVFPLLEKFRADIIRKYESRLQIFLPIRSSNNDRVDKAADLEIGQLYYICGMNRITEPDELEKLRIMREARNTLAHWEPLPYDRLKELKIL